MPFLLTKSHASLRKTCHEVEGWIDCFERARLAGTVFMGGVTTAGEKPEHPALEKARLMGAGA